MQNPKKDRSPKTPQKNKIDYELRIRERNDLSEKQLAFLELVESKGAKLILLDGPAGCSKAQPLDALVLTPNGYNLMGNLKVGDLVISIDGLPTKVLGIFPQGKKEIYEVTFSDSSKTECTLDHLWLTQTDKDRNFRKRTKGNRRLRYKSEQQGTVKSLGEILKTLISRKGTKQARYNHTIPITEPVHFKENDNLEIDPYLLGVLLGDGGFTTSNINITSADSQIIEKCSKVCPDSIFFKKQATSDYGYSLKIKDKSKTPVNPIKTFLIREKLFGLKSSVKFIPERYKLSSIVSRIEILRGLMDTDGHVTKSGSSIFTTTSLRLAQDVEFIVNSLGGIVKTSARENFYPYKGIKKRGLNSYSLCICMPPEINPFYLSRKSSLVIPKTKYKPSRYIISIKPICKKECQCILVENPSHLYLTNNCIVTHNTFLAILAALRSINSKKTSHLVYVRSIIESASKSIGALPGLIEEKLNPFLLPLRDKLDELISKADADKLMKDERIESIPINFLRGANFNATFLVVDEAQNLTFSELTTVITRQGEYSKFILCGDSAQSDLNGKSGFTEMWDLFYTQECQENGVFCVKFDSSDIVRSGIVRFIVEKLEEYNKTHGVKKH